MLTDATRTALRQSYLLAFDNFTTRRSEVAEVLGVDKKKASSLLNKLRAAGLIDSYDVNDASQGSGRRGAYAEVEWQCFETYDSISREEAEKLFDKAFPVADAEATKPRRAGRKPAAAKNADHVANRLGLDLTALTDDDFTQLAAAIRTEGKRRRAAARRAR
jgi:predicted transcriptional regulator